MRSDTLIAKRQRSLLASRSQSRRFDLCSYAESRTVCAATALSIHQFFFHLVQLEQCTSSLCQEQAAAMRSEVASTLTEALGRYVIYLKHCATRPPFRCAPAHRERADRAGRDTVVRWAVGYGTRSRARPRWALPLRRGACATRTVGIPSLHRKKYARHTGTCGARRGSGAPSPYAPNTADSPCI